MAEENGTLEKEKQKAEEIASKIDQKLVDMDGKVKELGLKDGEISKSVEDMQGEIKSLMDKWKEQQEQVDKLDRRSKNPQSVTDIVNKTFADRLKAKLMDKETIERIGELKKSRSGFSIDVDMSDVTTKAVADMTTGAHLTDTTFSQRVPGVVYDPERRNHIRDLISVGSVSSDTIAYMKETGGEGTPGMQVEGETKAQIDIDLAEAKVSIETLAAFVVMSTQMVNDYPFIQSYISMRLPEKLKVVEDVQVLNGNGTPPNLNGLYTQAQTYAEGAFADTFAAPQQIDVIATAIDQAIVDEYYPNRTVLHPTDYTKIMTLKDSTGRYLLDSVLSGMIPVIAGVPIYRNTAMAAGNFLVGDFMLGAQLFDRESINIAFSYEDSTNFRQNKVTVRAEERLALVVFRPNAFVKGTFATAIAALLTP